MAWIESHQELARHPKTKRAARDLGVSVPTMIGHLHLLWWWALDFADGARLDGWEAADIAEAAMWDGDAQVFVDALCRCGGPRRPGFLEVSDGVLVIHDWKEYAGRLLDRREKDRDRKRQQRELERQHREIERQQLEVQRQQLEEQRKSLDVRRTSGGHLTDGDGSPGVPDLTGPDRTEPSVITAVITAAPDDAASSGLFESLKEKLKTAKNRTAVLMEAYTALFGGQYQPNAGRLGDLGKRLGAAEFLKLMFRAAPTWNGVDDPHDYLTAAVQRVEKDRNSRSTARSPTRLTDAHEPTVDWAEVIRLREEETKREYDTAVANGYTPNGANHATTDRTGEPRDPAGVARLP